MTSSGSLRDVEIPFFPGFSGLCWTRRGGVPVRQGEARRGSSGTKRVKYASSSPVILLQATMIPCAKVCCGCGKAALGQTTPPRIGREE